MKKLGMITFASIALLFFTAGMAAAATFTIMTEENPPFNYTDNGKVTGVSTEIVEEIAKRVGHPADIKVMPWARGYGLLQKQDGKMLYSTTRNEKRENMFKWVGPLLDNKWVFFAKKGSGLSISSLDDAKKVKKVGAYKDDVKEGFLKDNGFTNVESVIDDTQNPQKLAAGRIDLWITSELPGIQKAKDKGVADQLEKVFEIKSAQLSIAVSKNTPDEEIAKWQAALDEMKQDGTYEAILKKYM